VHTITLGRHHITAEYHGDTPCAASVSKPVAVTITAVSPATPSTTFVPGPGLTGDIRSSGPTLAPILVALALVVLVFAGGLTGRRLRHAGSPRHRD
jgi:hypothetical protein